MSIVRNRYHNEILILSEEAETHQVYRFRGKLTGVVTLVAGLASTGGAVWTYSTDPSEWVLPAILGGVSILLYYGSLFGFTTEQWLRVDGRDRSIRFHKKSIHGAIDWDRPGTAFAEIRVFKNDDERNWSILLTDRNGAGLYLGENELGAMKLENALRLATTFSALSGVPVMQGFPES
jgi:hypothetical protein